jgi:hypothetical protein
MERSRLASKQSYVKLDDTRENVDVSGFHLQGVTIIVLL